MSGSTTGTALVAAKRTAGVAEGVGVGVGEGWSAAATGVALGAGVGVVLGGGVGVGMGRIGEADGETVGVNVGVELGAGVGVGVQFINVTQAARTCGAGSDTKAATLTARVARSRRADFLRLVAIFKALVPRGIT
jgi:hypothetical protein